MPAKLLYRDAQGRDSAVDLVPEGSFVGRGPDCLVRTDDAMVSRKNCKISVLGGRWYVEDMNSANGTYLNDRKLAVKEVLNHNDIIKCGSLQVRFVEMSDATYPSASAVPTTPVVPSAPAVPAVPVRPTHPVEERKTGLAPKLDTGGSGSASARAVAEQKDDELKRAAEERDAARAAAAEAQKAVAEAGAKLEAASEAQKRLGAELSATKKALEDLKRQSGQIAQELAASEKLNQEFRQEQKQLKEQVTQCKAQVEELRVQVETKDRQLTAANDDVRRSKQTADALNAKLQESTKAKDDQIRALNDQRGDVEHLREVLKENERIIEERRVALISLQEKVKDLEKRGSAQEKELAAVRTERDGLKQQNARAQEREADLRKMLQDSQAGGDQVAQLSRENSKLQEEIERLQSDRKDLQALVEQGRGSDQEVQQLRAQLAQLTEERKAFQQKLKDSVEQAAKQVADQVKQQMEARLEEALAARQTAEQNAAEAQRAAQAAQQALEEQKRSAATPVSPPAAAAPPSGEAERLLIDIKAIATTAYDGINVSLSELRLSIAQCQETFVRMERTLPDRDAARKLRDAIEATMDRADEAKGHVRSLRSVIE